MSGFEIAPNDPAAVDCDAGLPRGSVDYPNVLTCDVCGALIKRPEQGMLRWYTHRVGKGSPPSRSGLSVVHHAVQTPGGRPVGCYEKPPADCGVGDEHLSDVCGAEGVSRLLTMAQCDGLPFDEAAVMIHRLLVPGYDRVRRYEDQAMKEGLLDTAPLDGLLAPREVRELLLHVER